MEVVENKVVMVNLKGMHVICGAFRLNVIFMEDYSLNSQQE